MFCSSNLLELPDLRYVSNPVERAKAIINFQVDAITVIVLGDVQDSGSPVLVVIRKSH